MFNAFHLWLFSIGAIIAAFVVSGAVLERLFAIIERLKYLEGERSSHWHRIDDLEESARTLRTRCESLEKRPPVVNVVNEIKGAK